MTHTLSLPGAPVATRNIAAMVATATTTTTMTTMTTTTTTMAMMTTTVATGDYDMPLFTEFRLHRQVQHIYLGKQDKEKNGDRKREREREDTTS